MAADPSHHPEPALASAARPGPAAAQRLERVAAPHLSWRWAPADAPRALVVVVHGFGEHAARYAHVQQALAASGFPSLAFDLRGHGASGGPRTHVHAFADYQDDLAAALALGRERAPDLPVFVLGHSLGGLIALAFALERPAPLRGLVITSPALRFAVKVPVWKHACGVALARVLPRLRMPSGTRGEHLTHDPAVAAAVLSDPRMVFSATARWYTECLAAQRRVAARAGELRLPLLVLAAGDDRLVDVAATREWFERAGAADKELVVHDGWWHEVLQEVERQRALAAVAAWLAARC